MKKALFFSLFLMMMLLILIAGCISYSEGIAESGIAKQQSTPKIVTGSLGDTLQSQELYVMLYSAEKRPSFDYTRYGKSHTDYPEDSMNDFLIIGAEVGYIGEDSEYIGQGDFSANDENGYTCELDILSPIDNKFTILEELFPGQKYRGTVVFEVPKDSKSFDVWYDFKNYIQNPKSAKWHLVSS